MMTIRHTNVTKEKIGARFLEYRRKKGLAWGSRTPGH